MLYGFQKINGHNYYFDTTTGAMKTGWLYVPNTKKLYYFNHNGQAATGTRTIANKQYQLDIAGRLINKTGQYSLDVTGTYSIKTVLY